MPKEFLNTFLPEAQPDKFGGADVGEKLERGAKGIAQLVAHGLGMPAKHQVASHCTPTAHFPGDGFGAVQNQGMQAPSCSHE